MAADCVFCKADLSESTIFEGVYWNVLLNKEQHYLGRSFIMLKRHEENVFNLSTEEKDELWQLAKRTSDSLTELFHPDMFNYAFLMNTVRHVHLHIYPRYKEKRVFSGETFEDGRFGQNFAPYEKRELDGMLFGKIANEMKRKF
jgi:diadenosine tetraphosphate (Ap4A) HIT family hydrolase